LANYRNIKITRLGLLLRDELFSVSLRKRVHGDEEVTGFAKIGRTVSFNIYSAINNTVPLGNSQRILDFGCGCGRILRYFHKLSANNTFYGTDIDGEAITWCSDELSSIAKFVQNDIHPPLPFDDETFDFVYSISIFTHLPEEMHLEWLRELKRVTKPGGYLLLTVHGEQLFNDIFGAAFERLSKDFNDKGFCYFEGEKTEGLPDFYQTSFHTKDYLFNKWTEFFEIKQFVAKGIANNQDLVLCRKIAP
jgi:SAM-dependent methyltransferase